MIDFLTILNRLGDAEVDFILVGALSAAVQGAQISTLDVDIVHSREAENLERLAAALLAMGARYRSHPTIFPTAERLAGPGHQLLLTDFGPLDVLGEIEGGLGFAELLVSAESLTVGEYVVHALSLRKYLELRRANPRPRDFARFPLIEAALMSELEPEQELVTVHVRLRDQPSELRPVESVAVGPRQVRLGPALDTSESWEFAPGTMVTYEERTVDGRRINVAVAPGDQAGGADY